MNLYKITFKYFHSLGDTDGISGYVIASSDEDMYNYIDDKYNKGNWQDLEEKEPNFKSDVIKRCGEIQDEKGDPYYGYIEYYWQLVKQHIDPNIASELLDLGIADIMGSYPDEEFNKDKEDELE